MKRFVSPKGQASYPSLTKPDTRFSAEGIYKTGLILSPEEAEPIVKMLEEEFQAEFGTKKKLSQAKMPVKYNEDGTVTISFKSKNAPKIVDAKGKPVMNPTELRIGGGSTIKISAAAKAYNAGGAVGVTCYLNAVQIISLVEYGSGGFTEEEGDFVDSTSAAPASELNEVQEEDVNF